jgi:O-methyltransferase involved in polyketide biosynthesis
MPDLRVYEIDFPSVLEHKNRVLYGAAPLCKRVTVGADFDGTDAWARSLEAAELFAKSLPSVWVLEGLTG